MKKRLLIALLAVIFIASLIGVTVPLLWGGGDLNHGVRITVEGEIVSETNFLTDTLPKTIQLEGKNGIQSTVTVEDGRVHVDCANCPDQICVHQGWITDGTLPIVCLPGEIIIEIVGGESSGLDTATG